MLPAVWEKPVLDLPEVWDYNDSVIKIKPMLLNWKTVTEDILQELYIAREMLSERVRSTTGTFVPMDKTWADYCEDIGLSKRTANRWLVQYAGREDAVQLVNKLMLIMAD